MKISKAYAALMLAAVVLVGGCVAHYITQSENRTSENQLFAMDTLMSFTATGTRSEEAVDAAMKEIQRLDRLLSTGDAASEVSAVNMNGGGEVSEDTANVFTAAVQMYEETGGLFDFTIYPLIKLWGFPTKEYRVPPEAEIAQKLSLVDASKAELAGCLVKLGEGQEIDFGGIAKGYASARVMDIFHDYGITSGLVSLGGNIEALGSKPDGTPWRIGIQNPEGTQGTYLGVLEVTDKAVVTSGGYERYFEENGHTYIHIIDPRTGKPAESDLLSVTVVSEDGTLADGLSTSLFIMGLQDAQKFWREHLDSESAFEMVLVDTGGKVYVSEGLAGSFTLADQRPLSQIPAWPGLPALSSVSD